MAIEFRKPKEEDIAEMFTEENIRNLLLSRRSAGSGEDVLRVLEVDGNPAIVCGKLGSGGTKEVYDVAIEGEHYALGLHGIIDHPRIILAKWSNVLKEPANTERLRDLGLIVNEFCQIAETSINGHPFPAIVMTRYQDHQFPIYDSKNTRGNNNEVIGVNDEVTDEKTLSVFSAMSNEIASLLKGGVSLGADCFNICLVQGVPHIYFADLGAITFGIIPANKKADYAVAYVRHALSAFVNSVSDRVYRRNQYVHSMTDLDSPLERRLTETTLAKSGR